MAAADESHKTDGVLSGKNDLVSDADTDLTGQQAGVFRIGGVVGLCWMIADHLLQEFQPFERGWPDIGGGFLLIAACVTVTAHAVVIGTASAVRPPRWNSMTTIGLAVVAALAFAYLLFRALRSLPGAITMSAARRPQNRNNCSSRLSVHRW